MTDRKATMTQASTWPCSKCGGRGIAVEILQEFYHGSRTSRPVAEYCDSCLMQGHCPVCGGGALWDEEAERFRVCPACGHDVELVGVLVAPTVFERSICARRLTSAIAPGVGLILRYLTTDGLFVEFRAAGGWLRYRRSYWWRQSLVEAAQAVIEAFDDDLHRPLSPWLPERLFEEIRASLGDLENLGRAAAAVAQAYQAMPYDHPFGRGLNSSHFDMLIDALSPSAQHGIGHVNSSPPKPPEATATDEASFEKAR
jgi:hypothetical protein